MFEYLQLLGPNVDLGLFSLSQTGDVVSFGDVISSFRSGFN